MMCSSEVPVEGGKPVRIDEVRKKDEGKTKKAIRRMEGVPRRRSSGKEGREGRKERGRTWRSVDDQVIQLSPPHLSQKLLDHGVLLRPSPHDALCRVGEEEPDAHAGEDARLPPVRRLSSLRCLLSSLPDDGRDSLARCCCCDRLCIEVNGDPAVLTRQDVPSLHAEHSGERRTGQVDVEEADAEARVGGEEREGELNRDGGLADAALAGEDEEDVGDGG